MRKRAASIGLALLTVAAVTTTISVAAASGTNQSTLVNAAPSKFTPNINDGTVNAITEVGTQIVAGGTFSSVSPPGNGNGANAIARHFILSFDENTGVVSTTFVPTLDGAVETLKPGPTAGTVYVGGDFNNVNGVKAKGVALLQIANGQMVAGFAPAPMNGVVFSMARFGNRLLIGGTFTSLNGSTHDGIGTLNATTGALDPYVNVQLTGHHNYTGAAGQSNGGVGPRALDISPDGTLAVVIGNFKMAAASPTDTPVTHDQIAEINLGATAGTLNTSWNTSGYTATCISSAYDTYMRDVSFAPDGSYFAVAATGGGTFSQNTDGSRALCDTATRWETSSTGDNVQPTWIDYTGNDTFLSVVTTGTAIYLGGHQRWVNNDASSDSPGPGAIPRPGIVALDPVNGMPFSWNPGRNPRGVGAGALLATANGLYMGSDTASIGTGSSFATRGRVAFFPLTGGESVPQFTLPVLPATIYSAGQLPGGANSNVLYRVDAGGPQIPAIDNGPDWAADTSDPSPYRNSGSSTAAYGQVANIASSVPASTPSAIFNSERWDPGTKGDGQELQWSFPVAGGTPIEVRLYFANRYTGTDNVGQRAFDVSLDGSTVLNNYDIVADAGTQTGEMKKFDITAPASGQVTIGLGHEVENPLINGIEIVRTDVAPPPASALDTLQSRSFDGHTAGSVSTVDSGTIPWSQVRGAFMAGNTLFYGDSDGKFYRATFNGSSIGTPSLVDPYDDPVWSDVQTGSGQTYRGTVPTLYGSEMQSVTGMVLSNGRLYYSLAGQAGLRYRYFEPDDGALGGEFTAGGNVNFSNIAGMFLAGNSLYYADKATGDLHGVAWNAGAPDASTDTVVSTDTDWRARGLFALQAVAPTAAFTESCTGLTCSFNGGTSSAPGGKITSYAWNFGDGHTGAGVSVGHTFAAGAKYTVTLTITSSLGGSAASSQQVTVTAPPPPPPAGGISFVGTASANGSASSLHVVTPNSVQAGDGLLLAVTVANKPTVATPSGWTLVASSPSSTTTMVTDVFRRVATASDAGAAVSVAWGEVDHATVQMLVYRGTSASNPVVSATVAMAGSGTSIKTPTVSDSVTGSWVVSYWSAKSSAVNAWTAPSGQAVRDAENGSGSGRINSLATDGGKAATPGTVGGLTGTADGLFGAGAAWTIILTP